MWDRITELLQHSAFALGEALQLLVGLTAFFVLLGLFTGKDVWADFRRALSETSLNVQIFLFNLLLVVPLIALGATSLETLFATHDLHVVGASVWASLPAAVVVFLAVFVGDFIGYWRHRIEHTPLLWPAHAVHHSDTEMTWFSLERIHPINRVTTFVIDASALLLFAFPPYAIVATMLVRHYYGFFIHANLPWTYGPLGLVFVSPAMHRWHHAADRRAFNTNYATVFSVFDRLFGTYRVPGPCTAPLGVTDDMQKTLAGQLGYAFTARAYARFLRRFRRAPTAVEPGRSRDGLTATTRMSTEETIPESASAVEKVRSNPRR